MVFNSLRLLCALCASVVNNCRRTLNPNLLQVSLFFVHAVVRGIPLMRPERRSTMTA
jgi:hypothetical protein